MRVLIVDDVGCVRHSLSSILQRLGHVPLAEASGPLALETLRSDQGIGCVLADQDMPGMDGFRLFQEASRIVRLDDQGTQTSGPPFILMTTQKTNTNDAVRTTSHRKCDVANEAKARGFAGVLSKPFNVDELQKLLAHVASRNRPRVDPAALLRSFQSSVDAILSSENESLVTEFRAELSSTLARARTWRPLATGS